MRSKSQIARTICRGLSVDKDSEIRMENTVKKYYSSEGPVSTGNFRANELTISWNMKCKSLYI